MNLLRKALTNLTGNSNLELYTQPKNYSCEIKDIFRCAKSETTLLQ